ncbi:MAG: bifunctional adenosylcobinamide kinase/adenosylcobinamide-phosphate guanylyltransferase [Candidatus Omnitrophota bacterium]
MSRLILITGGARSGKSTYAQNLAKPLKGKIIYIATAEALDEEMKKRVSLHKKSRPKDWLVIEEPLEVLSAVKKLPKERIVIILDCLTLLISNLIFKGLSDNKICANIKAIAEALKRKAEFSIVVTNEVGSGIVPGSALARRFRDIQGTANQIMGKCADEVYLLVSSIPVKIK